MVNGMPSRGPAFEGFQKASDPGLVDPGSAVDLLYSGQLEIQEVVLGTRRSHEEGLATQPMRTSDQDLLQFSLVSLDPALCRRAVNQDQGVAPHHLIPEVLAEFA